MAGLSCRLCSATNIETEVRVVFNNRIIFTSNSGLKSWDWAIDNYKTPCTLRYTYVCNKCGYSTVIAERFLDDKLHI